MTNSNLHIDILTLFPDMFPGFLRHSLAGKALNEGIWSYNIIDIRDFSENKHAIVDDIPYGGGSGMVMCPDVLSRAIESLDLNDTELFYMSPKGTTFTQKTANTLAKSKKIAIICARFEGIDQRILDAYPIKEISIGDYVLSGGEVAALTVMDACIRLLPGVLGNGEDTLKEESFCQTGDYAGLLEYPLYTRPAEWQGRRPPEVLLSGHHKKIHNWRLKQAQEITKQRRPDLWECYKKKQEIKE